MIKRCPDCRATARLHSDYPSSLLASFLKSLGLIRVKRCSNCNAEVFVVFGLLATSRRRFKRFRERAFWSFLVFWLVIVGYIVFEGIMK